MSRILRSKAARNALFLAARGKYMLRNFLEKQAFEIFLTHQGFPWYCVFNMRNDGLENYIHHRQERIMK